LGGSKGSDFTFKRNILITFLLSGLWHGGPDAGMGLADGVEGDWRHYENLNEGSSSSELRTF